MKRLLLKVFLLAVIVLLSYGFLLWVFIFHTEYEDSTDYMSAYLDKVERIQSLPSPKIIFLGGSNLAFGLDSEVIEKGIGLPVVNMGLHAGIGLKYMLDSVRPYVREGDVVVVIPEYEQFFGSYYGGEMLLKLMHVYPPGLLYVHAPQQAGVLMAKGKLIIRKKLFLRVDGRAKTGDVYSRKAFNQYGDVVSHLAKPVDLGNNFSSVRRLPITKKRVFRHSDGFDNRVVEDLEEFSEYVQSRKARFIFLFPCKKQSAFEKGAPYHLTVYDRLLKSKIGGEVSRTDYNFPDAFFYDTEYHLNAVGRSLRSEMVLGDLKHMLHAPAGVPPQSQLSLSSRMVDRLWETARSVAGFPNSTGELCTLQREEFCYMNLQPVLANIISNTMHGDVHTEGFGALEGPFPQSQLPHVRWMKHATAKIVYNNKANLTSVSLMLSFRQRMRPRVRMAVRCNNILIKTFETTQNRDWLDVTLHIPLRTGINVIEFTDEELPGDPPPERSLYMLFKELALVTE